MPRTDENAHKMNQSTHKTNLLRISTPQKMALNPVLKALSHDPTQTPQKHTENTPKHMNPDLY